VQPAAQSVAGARAGRHGALFASSDRGLRLPAVLALIYAGLGVAPGCSGQSSFLTGGPTVGQLKTSLSHLEYENQQLKRSVAKLEQENRSVEDRLVQEQIDNGDLAARLDDARNLLSDRGIDPDVRVGSRRGGDGVRGSSAVDDGSAPRTLPTGQRARQRRKPPFAHISGPVNTIPPIDDDNDDGRDPKADRAGRRFDDDLDHHSFYTGPLGWLPVAEGTGAGTSRLR